MKVRTQLAHYRIRRSSILGRARMLDCQSANGGDTGRAPASRVHADRLLYTIRGQLETRFMAARRRMFRYSASGSRDRVEGCRDHTSQGPVLALFATKEPRHHEMQGGFKDYLPNIAHTSECQAPGRLPSAALAGLGASRWKRCAATQSEGASTGRICALP